MAAHSGCRGWWGAGARSKCCWTERPWTRRRRCASDSSTRWFRRPICCRTARHGWRRCWPTARRRWHWRCRRWTWGWMRPSTRACALRPRRSASRRPPKTRRKARGRSSKSGAPHLLESETMSRVIEGQLASAGLKFAIVLSRFNSFVTDRLLAGAMDALARTGCRPEDVEVVKVPGSWEIPLAAKTVAAQKRHDAVICLSAVIRGDTPHFDYVAAEASKGLAQVSLETGVPVAFGVLTTNNLEQAIDRAGAKSGNKGFDAAMGAVEMGNLMRKLRDAR